MQVIVIQKSESKSNLTQDKPDGMMKLIHWNNLIKNHIFENRIYVKIKKCEISNEFPSSSTAVESLGDTAVQQLKKTPKF